MSMNFSAMQYDKAFDAKRMQNWQVQKDYKIGEPQTRQGFTAPVANDNGHLLPGVRRSADSPWGNYVGTWDLPCHAPGNYIGVSTGRAAYAQEKLERDAENFRRKAQQTVDKKRSQKADVCASGARECSPEPAASSSETRVATHRSESQQADTPTSAKGKCSSTGCCRDSERAESGCSCGGDC